MTAAEAYQTAVEAREQFIRDTVDKAVNDGQFQMRVEKLLPEQKSYLEANGYKVREIEQKGGSTYEINWEQ